MNQQAIDQLNKVVYEYSVLKKQYWSDKDRLIAMAENQEITPFTLDKIIEELHQDVFDSPERQAYNVICQRSKTDKVLEKYLRAAHSEYIYGVPLDPNKL